MTVKDLPPLVASGGELTVVYRSAAYVYGKWSVTYPDGVQPKKFEYGRTLGFVGVLPGVPKVGRGARCWVNSDITVNAPGKYSSAPAVFEAAAKRTSGEVLFDATIGVEGLGSLQPGVDFETGDEVPVLVGGSKLLNLPVREIAVSVESGKPRYEVSVGGELTDQPLALDEYNDSLLTTINEENYRIQQELEKQKQYTDDSVKNQAKKTEAEYTKAIAAAVDAKEKSLVDAITGRSTQLDAQGQVVRKALEGSQTLAARAQAAYNDLNTIQWIDQAAWNNEKERTDVMAKAWSPHPLSLRMVFDSGTGAFVRAWVKEDPLNIFTYGGKFTVSDGRFQVDLNNRPSVRFVGAMAAKYVSDSGEEPSVFLQGSSARFVHSNIISGANKAVGLLFDGVSVSGSAAPFVGVELLGVVFPESIAPMYQGQLDRLR